MSPKISILKYIQLAMEEKGYEKILHMAAQEEDDAYNEEEHITTNAAHVYDMYYQLI